MDKYVNSQKTPYHTMLGRWVVLISLGCLLLQGPSVLAQTSAADSQASCFTCHNKAPDNAILGTSHGEPGTPTPGVPFTDSYCESCHGASTDHARTLQSPAIVFGLEAGQYPLSQVSVQNQVCTNCHASAGRTLSTRRGHQTPGLACATCHSLHTRQ